MKSLEEMHDLYNEIETDEKKAAQKDEDGNTLLHQIAALSNKYQPKTSEGDFLREFIFKLLQSSVDPTIKNKEEKTAYESFTPEWQKTLDHLFLTHGGIELTENIKAGIHTENAESVNYLFSSGCTNFFKMLDEPGTNQACFNNLKKVMLFLLQKSEIHPEKISFLSHNSAALDSTEFSPEWIKMKKDQFNVSPNVFTKGGLEFLDAVERKLQQKSNLQETRKSTEALYQFSANPVVVSTPDKFLSDLKAKIKKDYDNEGIGFFFRRKTPAHVAKLKQAKSADEAIRILLDAVDNDSILRSKRVTMLYKDELKRGLDAVKKDENTYRTENKLHTESTIKVKK